jgi:hypothetical protein
MRLSELAAASRRACSLTTSRPGAWAAGCGRLQCVKKRRPPVSPAAPRGLHRACRAIPQATRFSRLSLRHPLSSTFPAGTLHQGSRLAGSSRGKSVHAHHKPRRFAQEVSTVEAALQRSNARSLLLAKVRRPWTLSTASPFIPLQDALGGALLNHQGQRRRLVFFGSVL